jgi:tripartite-type tricarboxylate transporter receptor subunit TctC
MLSGSLLAESFPQRQVELVVPYPPGASVDLIARILQPRLRTALGQTVVVENKAGAGGNVGAAYVAKSPPDGHRLLLATNAIITINPHVTKGSPFDAMKDLTPVALIANGPMAIGVRTEAPMHSIAELVEYARKNPGKLSYGTAGNGSPHHIIGELLKQQAGIFMVHVPYRGIGPAVTDLLGGNLDVIVSTLAGLSSQVAAGKIRLLGVTEAQRFQGMPQVPTVAETIPGVIASSWFGIYAPTGTPPDVVRRLHDDIQAAVNAEDVKARLLAAALDPISTSLEQFARLGHDDYQRWGALVRARHITAD